MKPITRGTETNNNNQQLPPRLPGNFRRSSQENHTTLGAAGPDMTPHTRFNRQTYEFDSCISTEEAFFGHEERKTGGGSGTGQDANGSNPQEDSTPKSTQLAMLNRRTADSLNRGSETHKQINAGFGFAANRQRTQRLSPKGKSMGREQDNTGQTSGSPQDRGGNQSVKLLDPGFRDDSQGSGGQGLKSEVVSHKQTLGKKKGSRVKVNRQTSNQNLEGFKDQNPLLHSGAQQQSSHGSGILMESDLSDLGGGLSTPVRRATSRQSMAALPDEANRVKGLGSGFRGQNPNTTTTYDNYGNISRPQDLSNPREPRFNAMQSESQRIIGGITQPLANTHAGQASMKIDMKFGWRPSYTDKDRLHRKDAIAIKLSYPSSGGLMRSSVLGSPMFSEMYRNKKNYRNMKKNVKKAFIADFPCKLVYQGYRPTVSLELHLRYGQKVGFNEDSQFYDVLIPKNVKQKALENGYHKQTPRCPVDESTLKTLEDAKSSDLTFDSMFESGNLDLALQVQPREFNLYLRPDTNTKGYCNWFFFKVKRKPDASGRFPRRSYHFNIMNMYKKKILYRQEAKPLACLQEIHYKGFIMQELENVSWRSDPFCNVGYGLVPSHAQAHSNATPDQGSKLDVLRDRGTYVPQQDTSQRKQKYYCLSFDFEFPNGAEFAYLASSIPYPYTFLQKTIKTCVRLDQAMTTLTRSLGGLQIPMLTITNEVVNIRQKRTVIICGRIHPGETHSSWVLHGIIDYLISRDASHLRDTLVFKIVPMINPDGVVCGNYRTSFIGKDLNRLYLKSDEAETRYNMDDILKPEIQAMKQLIKGCKQDDSKGILAFIDVHHHSQKRGAFMYGPSYQMQNSKYQEVRVLPKLLSMMLPEIFRFQSCRFKDSSYKEDCARVYCDREQGITYSFCLETSQQGYFTSEPVEHDFTGATKGRHIRYFDQNSLMFLGRKICEASYMLNEMSDVQDQKRDAIKRRRTLRMNKKAGGKKALGAKGSTAGRSGYPTKGSAKAADQNSMGATDFDMDSEDPNHSSNVSVSSYDFIHGGVFRPKIGLKGFIAQMMNKPPKSGDLKQDSSRGALRVKNTRPLTHFGSEDAVSEKSEKQEESLSDVGSDEGSSAQDLSEDEQNKVLDQVMDQLMPNRRKKIVPVTAQVTVKPAPVPTCETPMLQKPTRKMLRSANRVINVDRRHVQKEQLLMPTAEPHLQVTFGEQHINFEGSNQPLEFKVSSAAALEESKQHYVVPVNQQKIKEDLKRVTNEKGSDNPFLAVVRPPNKKPVVDKIVQGCYLPGANQGYISQRQVQNKKRVLSSRQKKGPQGDMFANTGYQPPGVQRQAQAKGNAQVQSNRIYSVAQQQSAPQQSHFVQAQNIKNVAVEQAAEANLPMMRQNDAILRQSYENQQQAIINRQNLRTAGNRKLSHSHTKDDVSWQAAQPTAQLVAQRQSYNRANGKVYTTEFDHTRAAAATALGKPSRNEVQGQIMPGMSQDQAFSTAYGEQQSFAFQQQDVPLESQWLISNQAHQQLQNSPLSLFEQHAAATTSKMQQQLKSPLQKPPLHRIGSAIPSKIKAAMIQKEVSSVNTTTHLTSKYSKQEPQHRFSPEQKAPVPLSMGGFFHRNQIVGTEMDELNLIRQQMSASKTNHMPPDVIIRTKPSAAGLMQKRASAIANANAKNMPHSTGPINRISHKRTSQQHPLLAEHNNNYVDESYVNSTRPESNMVNKAMFSNTTAIGSQRIHNLRSSHSRRGMSEDMTATQPLDQLFNSPQKLSSQRPQYAQTVSKKTDALIVSNPKNWHQPNYTGPGSDQRQLTQPALNSQSSRGKIIASRQIRSNNQVSENNRGPKVQSGGLIVAASNNKQPVVLRTTGQFNRIGHTNPVATAARVGGEKSNSENRMFNENQAANKSRF